MPRLVVAILATVLLIPAFSAAQELSYKVTGVVKQLDVKVGTVTVRPTRKGATEDETFSFLKKDIAVTTPSGQKTRLEAVAPGQTVQLVIGTTGDVEAVVIQAPAFLATVVDLDASKRMITIARPENRTATMAVAADAKIWLAGRSAYLREIKLCSLMTVTASLDGKTALGLNLVADPDGKLATKLFPRVKISRLPGTRLVGVLTDVQAGKNELQLVGPKTKGVPTNMPLAKDAVIQVIHGQVAVQNLALNQVVKWANATVLVSPESQQVTRVFVTPPTVLAKVKILAADGGQLTVEMDGNEKSYLLPKDFKVMAKNRVRRLGDLQPDLAVTLVLSLDRKQLLAVDLQ